MEKMWSDGMTKPQQEQLFWVMRTITMNSLITRQSEKMMKISNTSIPSSQGCVRKVPMTKNADCDIKEQALQKILLEQRMTDD